MTTSSSNFTTTLCPSYQLTQNHFELPAHNLNFFYANVRSILKKGRLQTLKDILKTIRHDVDVIVLTETWIKEYDEAQTVILEDYEHFFNIRESESRGGGVSIYVKRKLQPLPIFTEYLVGANFLWVYLSTHKLYIGGIYNPNNKSNKAKFLQEYSKQLKDKGQAIVFGDFNINLRVESKARNYKKTLEESGFKLLNSEEPKYSTRTKPETRTIIDHVSTNLSGSEYQMWHLSVIESKSLSDHNQLYLAVPKITPSEGNRQSSNKRMRLNTNGDKTQATNEEDNTGEANESNEASEVNSGTHSDDDSSSIDGNSASNDDESSSIEDASSSIDDDSSLIDGNSSSNDDESSSIDDDSSSIDDDSRTNQDQHRSSSPDNLTDYLCKLFE